MVHISDYQVLPVCIGVYNQDETQSSLDNVINNLQV